MQGRELPSTTNIGTNKLHLLDVIGFHDISASVTKRTQSHENAVQPSASGKFLDESANRRSSKESKGHGDDMQEDRTLLVE